MSRLFGTDGIRGRAGKFPLDRHSMWSTGCALALWVKERHENSEVVIGVDTRESGQWIAEHLAGGLKAQQVPFRFAGLISTPGLAHATRVGPFAAGVMISASHNPYHDNGIKIIDHSGFKLADDQEDLIATDIEVMNHCGLPCYAMPVTVDEGLDREYIEYLAGTMTQSLKGLRVVVDGANGSASKLGPELFRRLGADVITFACEPDGQNINLNCGSLHLEGLQERVRGANADLGVAFDGDADRALFVSKTGKIIDGDAVLFLSALPLKKTGKLKEVVATVMSNLGLERALAKHGIGLIRTSVGDRYVIQEMLKRDAPLGGEQSGHIIYRDYSTTGDGMLTALRVMNQMQESGATLDDLTAEVVKYPQILVNVKVKNKRPIEDLERANKEIRHAEAEFGEAGRILVRFSGTEPLARVMVEGPEQKRVEHFAHSIANAIKAELGE
ncbi:MAG: phosphoglucosamine mutase [Bryobacteraceae bacterium]